MNIKEIKNTLKYSFSDNTDYKISATNLSKTALIKIIKHMSNIHTWGNLYSYHIQDSKRKYYEITTTRKGKPNGFAYDLEQDIIEY